MCEIDDLIWDKFYDGSMPLMREFNCTACGKNGLVETWHSPIMQCPQCRNKDIEFNCENCGPLVLKEWRPREPNCPKCKEFKVSFKCECGKSGNLREVLHFKTISCPGGLRHIIELGGWHLSDTEH